MESNRRRFGDREDLLSIFGLKQKQITKTVYTEYVISSKISGGARQSCQQLKADFQQYAIDVEGGRVSVSTLGGRYPNTIDVPRGQGQPWPNRVRIRARRVRQFESGDYEGNEYLRTGEEITGCPRHVEQRQAR